MSKFDGHVLKMIKLFQKVVNAVGAIPMISLHFQDVLIIKYVFSIINQAML